MGAGSREFRSGACLLISLVLSVCIIICLLIERGFDSSYSGPTIQVGKSVEEQFRFADIPIYYINLPKYRDRDKIIRAKLSSAISLNRVDAIDGTKIDSLTNYFDPGPNDLEEFRKNPAQYLYDRRTCVPGQLGNYLSHLRAIKAAHEADLDYAITMEDDYSDVYTKLWPIANLTLLIDQANERFPGWYAIRLQWHDYQHRINAVHEAWLNQTMSIREKSLLRKKSPEIPLSAEHKGGWGNMATLWSHQGLSYFADTYTSREDEDKFICLEGRPCAADLSFWTHDHILVTTPPLAGPNVVGVGTTEIRSGVWNADHTDNHRRAAAAQMLWLSEALEIMMGADFGIDASKNVAY